MRAGLVVLGLVLLGSCSESVDGAVHGGEGGTGGSVGLGANGGGSGVPSEVTLTMDPFTVPAGREVFMCQTFANPFGGVDVHIREFESHMTPGSHHLILNYADGVSGESPGASSAAPCSGLAAPTGPFTTQDPDDSYTYPPGIGALLEGTRGFGLNSHYFNARTEPITASVSVTVRRAEPGRVQRQALGLSLVYLEIDVPPHESATVTSGMTLSEDQTMEVLWMVPHMHSRGTHFRVATGKAGENVIYETDDWEVPPVEFQPPLVLRANDSLSYSCTWFNDTEQSLTFGESAANNEMCLLALHYTTPLP
jgi:hypothetical protein